VAPLIRKLRKDDARLLQECRLSGLRESPDAFLVTFGEVADTPLSQVEADLADADICYVGAFEGEELVGFMRYVRFQREARRHVAEVRSVYVRRRMRGRGIGSGLLRSLVAEARDAGLESLVLSVLADNQPAQRLYESIGFARYGVEPRAIRKAGHYQDQAHYSLLLSGERE